MPKVNVDFWHLFDDQGRFDPITSFSLIKSKKKKDRVHDHSSEHADVILALNTKGGETIGKAARIRKEHFPGIADLQTGDVDEWNLPEHKAPAEEVHFLYDSALKVFATQRNGFLRVSGIVGLINYLGKCDMFVQPILKKDKWNWFNKTTRIGAISLDLMATHHPSFSDVIPSMDQFLKQANNAAGAIRVNLDLTMDGSRKDSMDKNVIQKLIQTVMGKDGAEEGIKKFVVRGAAEGEGSQSVDFIADRLVFSDQLEYGGSGKNLNSEACQLLLRQAIDKNRAYLKSVV
jgi:hypothetical protein